MVEPYRLEAFNTAKASENKMHDDTVARKYGFGGGLVPGVDVMAYMMHLPVAKWGRAFLERGFIEARFVKPVYDGEIAEVSGTEDTDGISIEVASRDSLCATGTAQVSSPLPALDVAEFPETAPVADRLPVSPASFAPGQWLGSKPRSWPETEAATYLQDVREHDPIYGRERLVHPGVLQRIMNRVLVDNVILGPWIHVGSRMQLLAAAGIGDELTARARVTGNYEKKGHRFVELDALIVANRRTPVAHCQHVAIYQPREAM